MTELSIEEVLQGCEENPDFPPAVLPDSSLFHVHCTKAEFEAVMRGVISQNDLVERERIEREGLRSSEDLMVLTRLGDAMTDFDYGALLEAVDA